MVEKLEIVSCYSPLSWVLLAKERKREEKKISRSEEEESKLGKP